MDPRGDGGPWEDIKHLISYAVTIDATYTQAAKGREESKTHSDATATKGNANSGPLRGKESRRSKARHLPFYKKDSKHREEESSVKNTDRKDMRCFNCHKDGHLAQDCLDNKKGVEQQAAKKGKKPFSESDT